MCVEGPFWTASANERRRDGEKRSLGQLGVLRQISPTLTECPPRSAFKRAITVCDCYSVAVFTHDLIAQILSTSGAKHHCRGCWFGRPGNVAALRQESTGVSMHPAPFKCEVINTLSIRE
jgi:hypothetical protein